MVECTEFSDNEFAVALNKYRSKFEVSRPISESILHLCKSPFAMRIVFETYSHTREEIPQTITSKEILAKFLEKKMQKLDPDRHDSRNRLRKRKRGVNTSHGFGLRATYYLTYNKHRRTPEWGALDRAWVGYVIAKSQDDYEKMRKYAIVIRKFERLLNIAINDFPEVGIYGFEEREDFENKEEDDDSKLGVYDPWTRERIRDTKEDENEEEDEDSYYRSLYRR